MDVKCYERVNNSLVEIAPDLIIDINSVSAIMKCRDGSIRVYVREYDGPFILRNDDGDDVESVWNFFRAYSKNKADLLESVMRK